MDNTNRTDNYEIEHYTPADIVERVRRVFNGAIDCDPCSSAKAQETVRAVIWYDRTKNGLAQPWVGKVYVNPPGDPQGWTPKEFFFKLRAELTVGHVDEFIWLAFSISQLRTLQSVDRDLLSRCMVCIPESRIRFTGKSPTKDNAILYYGRNPDGFTTEFRSLGLILRGTV